MNKQEFMTDLTEPDDASDYLVTKPTTETTKFDSTKKTTIVGTVPKPLIEDPADPSKVIKVTNQEAGDVIVKLQGYDKNTQSYTALEYGTTTIPYDKLDSGDFSLDINANVVPDGTEVVLVAYSPNAKHPVMGDPFTFAAPDADKYTAKGGTLERAYGKKAAEQDILDKVTVTETKDGQETPAPADKVKSKAIKDTIPEPSLDGADQTVTVEVTYADGTKEEATVTIDYGAANEALTPEAQDIDVNTGEKPKAEDGIKNKDDLPAGTTYEWKDEPDTTKPGDQTGTVVVTYPDKSTEEVEVTIHVTDPQTQADKYAAEGDELVVPFGNAVVRTDLFEKVKIIDQEGDEHRVAVPLGSLIALPDGNAQLSFDQPDRLPDGTVPGKFILPVWVFYPDQSKEMVLVIVRVLDEVEPSTEARTIGGAIYKPSGHIVTSEEIFAVVATYAPEDTVQDMSIISELAESGQNQVVEVKVSYSDGTVETVRVIVSYSFTEE